MAREARPFFLDNPVFERVDLSSPLVSYVRYARPKEQEDEFDTPYFDLDWQATFPLIKRIDVRLADEVMPVSLVAYRIAARTLRGYVQGYAAPPHDPSPPVSPFGPPETRFRKMHVGHYFEDTSPGFFWRNGTETRWHNYSLGKATGQ